MLRTHLVICCILLLLCIPVYFLDHYFLKSSGGNWITLDFSYLLIKAYLIFLVVHFTFSTLAVIYYPHFNLLTTHLFSAILSLSLIALGIYVYNKHDEQNYNEKEHVKTEQRKTYFNDVQILRWWFEPNTKNPKEIHVDLKIASAGRFSAQVNGSSVGEDMKNIFYSDGEPQHLVKAGEIIHIIFPLTIQNPGQANSIEFTFYLFKHPVGESGPDDVSKVFKDSIGQQDDGKYFYEKLVPPLDNIPK
ncbi:MAG: hypothetical protein ABIY35_01005 [Chitinophagaceae bacterium]